MTRRHRRVPITARLCGNEVGFPVNPAEGTQHLISVTFVHQLCGIVNSFSFDENSASKRLTKQSNLLQKLHINFTVVVNRA